MSFITFLPENKSVPAEKNKSILDIAIDNDIILEHICGGVCSCTSCIILIRKGFKYFNSVLEQELYQLRKSDYNSPEARLACASKIITEPTENIIIEIPPVIEAEE